MLPQMVGSSFSTVAILMVGERTSSSTSPSGRSSTVSSSATGGQGYLSSLEEFDDFELYAEACISDTAGGRGNSGIYFRCAPHTDKKQEFPPGYEAQLDHGDSNNPTGSIYALNIEGARAPKPATKDGEWVTMRIRAVGNHLQTWVNSKPSADCRDSENLHTNGSILLQMHHLTGRVEFREVRIRKIAKKN